MQLNWWKLVFVVGVGICAEAASLAQQPSSGIVRIPKFAGPLPVTADNYPYMAANRTQSPIDLVKFGYVEEEFLFSGQANVYDWTVDGKVTIKTPNAPYATRMLIRRPSDPSRFNGTVIVETLNNARNYDWAFIWPLSYEFFIERGYAYAGVTHTPQAVAALKKFNPKRYEQLSFANPNPAESCGQPGATSDVEEGLRYDMMSQVAALLKSRTGPMAQFDVQYVYGTTHTREFMTYANSVHKIARLENGRRPYDGFVIKTEYAPVDRINRCAAAPDNGDPRQIIRNVDVPVIRVTAQGDVLATTSVRRPDSDEPNDRYRLWEVTAAPHMDKIFYQHMPVVEDQLKAGQTGFLANWPMAYAYTPDIDLLDFPVMRYAMNAAFAAMDEWVRKGIPAPRAERIGLNNAGAPQAGFITDKNGNGVGGIRSVYVDVPAATYYSNSPGQAVCNNLARKVPFDWARMESLYGSPKNYAARAAESINRLVKERWLTPSDGRRILAELSGASASLAR
jgi:hypothetical protein